MMVKNSKNRQKTTRRATSAIWGIFAEVDKAKRKLSTKLNIDAGKLVLAMFLN